MSTGPAQFAFGSLSLFMIPLAAEFSWDRTQISLASTFFTATLLFALPIAGRLVDTHGSKRVLVPSMLAVALLLAAIPLTLSEPWHLWLIFALIGSLGAGANALPYMRTVSACFDRHRGLAIGITLAGAGLGYSYVPPLLYYTIESHGWRSAYLLLGGIIIFIALPLVMWLCQDPRGESAPDAAPSRHLQGVSRSTALRGRTFWILFVVFSLLSFSLYGLMVHSVPMLVDRGMSPGSAALGATTIGVTIMIARVLTGYLCDRFFAPWVASAAFLLSTAGLIMLAMGGTDLAAYSAFVFIGFSIGAEIDMMTYLTTRYFGLRYFGEIYGILFASLLLGTSLGPLSFGWNFDATGSYTTILWLAAGGTAIAAIFATILPPYPISDSSA